MMGAVEGASDREAITLGCKWEQDVAAEMVQQAIAGEVYTRAKANWKLCWCFFYGNS